MCVRVWMGRGEDQRHAALNTRRDAIDRERTTRPTNCETRRVVEGWVAYGYDDDDDAGAGDESRVRRSCGRRCYCGDEDASSAGAAAGIGTGSMGGRRDGFARYAATRGSAATAALSADSSGYAATQCGKSESSDSSKSNTSRSA
jgi:hypothetical protein